MNPHACRVVLRRRGPLEVFDLALRFVQAHQGPFVRLMALTVLPFVPVAALACWLTDGHWALLLGVVVAAPFLQAPAVLLAGRLLFSPVVRVRDVLVELVRSPRRTAVVVVSFWLPFVVGCGVLAWIPAVRWCWMPEVTLLEQPASGGEGRRSGRLALLHLGVATSSVFGWYALTGWGAVAGESLGQALTGTVLQLGAPFGSAFDGQVTPFVLLGMLVAQPMYGVVHLLLYLDVRTRAEGWDLQVALRALGLQSKGPA